MAKLRSRWRGVKAGQGQKRLCQMMKHPPDTRRLPQHFGRSQPNRQGWQGYRRGHAFHHRLGIANKALHAPDTTSRTHKNLPHSLAPETLARLLPNFEATPLRQGVAEHL